MRRTLIPAALLAATQIPLHASAALLAGPPAGGPVTEVVQLKTSDGQGLEATFYRPATRSPGALLVHDAGASRAQLEPIAEKLSKQGFGVLLVDLRGHGGSKSERLDWEKLSESERKGTWSYAPRDLDAAAEWLLSQPTIHSTSLSLVGYGAGCALVVRHAKGDENVACMALLAPNVQDYGFDVEADIQTLEGLPTFVVTSKDDEAEQMVQKANASSGSPFLEISNWPAKLATPLEDKGLPARLTKWLQEKVVPKKGRGIGATPAASPSGRGR